MPAQYAADAAASESDVAMAAAIENRDGAPWTHPDDQVGQGNDDFPF